MCGKESEPRFIDSGEDLKLDPGDAELVGMYIDSLRASLDINAPDGGAKSTGDPQRRR